MAVTDPEPYEFIYWWMIGLVLQCRTPIVSQANAFSLLMEDRCERLAVRNRAALVGQN